MIQNITAKVTTNNGVYAQYENEDGFEQDATFKSWSTFCAWLAAENRRTRTKKDDEK